MKSTSPMLAKLNRDAHVKLLRPRMIAGPLQGRALKMFCRILRLPLYFARALRSRGFGFPPNPQAKFLTCVRKRFYAFFAAPDG